MPNLIINCFLNRPCLYMVYVKGLWVIDHNCVSEEFDAKQCKDPAYDWTFSNHYATYTVVFISLAKSHTRKLLPTRSCKSFNLLAFRHNVAMLPLLQLVQNKSCSLHDKVSQFKVKILNPLNAHLPSNWIRVCESRDPWLDKILFCLISIKTYNLKKIFQFELLDTVYSRKHYHKF